MRNCSSSAATARVTAAGVRPEPPCCLGKAAVLGHRDKDQYDLDAIAHGRLPLPGALVQHPRTTNMPVTQGKTRPNDEHRPPY